MQRRIAVSLLALALGASAAMALGATPAAADARQGKLVVVELFTSQGCSSCPPANANLIALSGRPGVLTLSYSVTYWDRLGWKDVFGKPEFTDRQATYEPALGERSPFTPQMVIQGRISRVGASLAELEAIIARAPALEGPDLALTPHGIAIGPGRAAGPPADVWFVTYDPGVVEVPVRRGENEGRTLPHGSVVHSLQRVGSWDGQPATFTRPATPQGLRTAVLVQAPDGGPILSAVTD